MSRALTHAEFCERIYAHLHWETSTMAELVVRLSAQGVEPRNAAHWPEGFKECQEQRALAVMAESVAEKVA